MVSINQESKDPIYREVGKMISEIQLTRECSKEQTARATELYQKLIQWFPSHAGNANYSDIACITISMLNELKDRKGLSPETFSLFAKEAVGVIKLSMEEKVDPDLEEFLDLLKI